MPLKKNPATGGWSWGKIGSKTKMTKEQVLKAVKAAFANGYTKGEDLTGSRHVKVFGKYAIVKGESFDQSGFRDSGNVTDLICQALADEISTFAEYTTAAELIEERDPIYAHILRDIANEEVTDHFNSIVNEFGLRAKDFSDIYKDLLLTKNGVDPQVFIGAIQAEDDAILTYETLAMVMPEKADFWNDIKGDEIEHRRRILERYVELGDEDIGPLRFE